MPIWHRHSDPLIELSLESSDAPAIEKKWTIRLEGSSFGIHLTDDLCRVQERLLIEREGTKITRIILEGVVVYDRGNSTS